MRRNIHRHNRFMVKHLSASRARYQKPNTWCFEVMHPCITLTHFGVSVLKGALDALRCVNLKHLCVLVTTDTLTCIGAKRWRLFFGSLLSMHFSVSTGNGPVSVWHTMWIWLKHLCMCFCLIGVWNWHGGWTMESVWAACMYTSVCEEGDLRLVRHFVYFPVIPNLK